MTNSPATAALVLVQDAGGFGDALVVPQFAAVALGEGVEMIVLGGDEDPPAIGHRRVEDRHADIDPPQLLAARRVERHQVAEAGGDEQLAVVIGDAAAEALGLIGAWYLRRTGRS